MSEKPHISTLPFAQGARIKHLRKITRLSRRGFSLKHGISPSTLQNCEEGRYNGLTQKMAQKLIIAFQAEGIDCQLSWLLHGKGQEPQHRFQAMTKTGLAETVKRNLTGATLLERALENERLHKRNASLFDATIHGRYQEVVNLINVDVDSYLYEGLEVKPYESEHNTPLHLAAMNGYLEIVKFLLKKGAKVDVRNRKNQTPLHLAVHNAHKEVIKILIQEHADIDATEDEGDTPLAWAAYKAQAEIVKLLIELGANIHTTNTVGNTPLYWAAEKGHTDIVKLLVEQGANVEAVNRDKLTPLLIAVQNGHIDTVKFLLTLKSN